MIESFCYSELGLKPKEYYALTIRQFTLMSEGNKRKIKSERLKSIDSWRQTRLLAYLLARDSFRDKNMSIHEFYPLPNDPTKEEIEADKKKDAEEAAKWQKQVIEKFRNKRKNLIL